MFDEYGFCLLTCVCVYLCVWLYLYIYFSWDAEKPAVAFIKPMLWAHTEFTFSCCSCFFFFQKLTVNIYLSFGKDVFTVISPSFVSVYACNQLIYAYSHIHTYVHVNMHLNCHTTTKYVRIFSYQFLCICMYALLCLCVCLSVCNFRCGYMIKLP